MQGKSGQDRTRAIKADDAKEPNQRTATALNDPTDSPCKLVHLGPSSRSRRADYHVCTGAAQGHSPEKALSSCMSNLRCRRTRTLWHSGSAFRRSSDSGEPVSWSATSGSQRTPRCMLRPSLPQPRSPCYRTGIFPQAEPQLRSTTTVVGAKVPSGPRIHRPSVEIVIVVYGALVPVFTKYPSPSR